MTNVSQTTSEYILKALLAAKEKEKKEAFELNPADVIKEEDYEESMGDTSHRVLSKLGQLVIKSPVNEHGFESCEKLDVLQGEIK